jgi:hypothetical protein
VRGRAVFAGFVALACWSSSTIDSNATPPKPKPAEELVKSGGAKLLAGDPADALADFEAADKLTPSYEIARLIGMCHDQLRHYHEAVEAYERYLWVAPQAMTVTFQNVRRRVDEIKAMPGTIRIETPASLTTVCVDGNRVAWSTPAEVSLPPGSHIVQAVSPGGATMVMYIDVPWAAYKAVRLDQTGATGGDDERDICQITPDAPQCVCPATEVPLSQEAKKSWKIWNRAYGDEVKYPHPPGTLPAIVTGGLALASAAVGTVFGGLALNDHYRYQSSHDAGTAAEGSNFAAVSDFGFIAAGAFAITSVIAYFKWYEPEWPGYAKRAHPPTLTASPFLTPHAAGAGALLRF